MLIKIFRSRPRLHAHSLGASPELQRYLEMTERLQQQIIRTFAIPAHLIDPERRDIDMEPGTDGVWRPRKRS